MKACSIGWWYLGAVVTAGLACTPSPDAGRAGDGSPVGGPPWTSWPGEVYEGRGGPDGKPVPIVNAKVCVPDRPDIACARSDEAGQYTLWVPVFDESAIVPVNLTAEGHLGRIRPAGKDWWPAGTGLSSDEDAATMARQAGFSYPARGTGFIEIRLFDGGVAKGFVGATATLSPPSGTGPIYADATGNPDPSLTSTSASGAILFGNVAPGRVTITVAAPGRRCDTAGLTGGTWLVSAPNTLPVVVAADSITDLTSLWCWE